MTDAEVYKNWPYRTRYLRPECWKVLKRIIYAHDITSVIEFGSGLSTILFNNMGVDVYSYETNPTYMRTIKGYNLANVKFFLWDNKNLLIDRSFGLALVDGALPRTNQLQHAKTYARYIAIDDFTDPESNQGLKEMLNGYTMIAGKHTKLAVFRRI